MGLAEVSSILPWCSPSVSGFCEMVMSALSLLLLLTLTLTGAE